MKKLILFVVALIVSVSSFAQSEIVPELKKFEDVSANLYITKIVEVPNKTKSEIKKDFKNWAGVNFVNLNEVLVGETEDQIVLSYVSEPVFWYKSLGSKMFYNVKYFVRMVVQFKDGKYKILIFDDGNVGQLNLSPRTIFLSKNSMTLEKPSPEDYRKIKYHQYGVTIAWQDNIDLIILSLENHIKNQTSLSNGF